MVLFPKLVAIHLQIAVGVKREGINLQYIDYTRLRPSTSLHGYSSLYMASKMPEKYPLQEQSVSM